MQTLMGDIKLLLNQEQNRENWGQAQEVALYNTKLLPLETLDLFLPSSFPPSTVLGED